MLRRIGWLVWLVYIWGTPVLAQEMWLQPFRFVFAPQEPLKVSFKSGLNFSAQPWDLSAHTIARLEAHTTEGVVALADRVKPGAYENVMFDAPRAGQVLVVLESNPVEQAYSAEDFNTYLQDEGHDAVYQQRVKQKLTASAARERRTYHAKLLVQVSEAAGALYRQPQGMALELICDQNPYQLKTGDPVRFTILWQGKPLFGAQVKVWNKREGKINLQQIYTETNGTISTHISNAGMWMVSVSHMTTSAAGLFETHLASFVFGVK